MQSLRLNVAMVTLWQYEVMKSTWNSMQFSTIKERNIFKYKAGALVFCFCSLCLCLEIWCSSAYLDCKKVVKSINSNCFMFALISAWAVKLEKITKLTSYEGRGAACPFESEWPEWDSCRTLRIKDLRVSKEADTWPYCWKWNFIDLSKSTDGISWSWKSQNVDAFIASWKQVAIMSNWILHKMEAF